MGIMTADEALCHRGSLLSVDNNAVAPYDLEQQEQIGCFLIYFKRAAMSLKSNRTQLGYVFVWVLLIFLQTSAFGFTLEISGKIKNHTNNETKTYVFSEEEILSMPVHAITTATSWTPKKKFEGVSLAEILQKVGVFGNKMTIYALNDYYIDIPLSDVEKYGVILAYKMDGERLAVRNFGPLFLIYPRDSQWRELNAPLYGARFVWQINRIVIE